ncbi:hypothetical protein HDU87_005441 [Geranomyces variabilis]|uniref:Fatty acid hydroxylase domain-containing protein n=1 Tax=Geranomyces variabilis TaxID=109894 RepID=A0AAD5TGX6_9FUNG|nr:hypothetical protein HDU87_005441 [Geranomyces variabilis]
MKTNWRKEGRSAWTFHERLLAFLDILPTTIPAPRHSEQDKIPYMPEWQMHRWILSRALPPLALHYAIVKSTGGAAWHPVAMVFFYAVWFKAIGIQQIWSLRWQGETYGFLDGQRARDDVPDGSAAKIVHSLSATSTLRPLLMVYLAYDPKVHALVGPHWLYLPLTIGLYGIVLDFWFYWYHRAMHIVGPLWKYHRTHHLTKHPNPLLTLYADAPQELGDIIGIPALTFFTLRMMGVPFNFYDWWLCGQYVVFSELAGHSGVRIHATPPSLLTPILRYFGGDLVIEDHDLHHRRGWRDSFNYGKQTRLWDRVFGTCAPRIESRLGNVDYEHPACIPLW